MLSLLRLKRSVLACVSVLTHDSSEESLHTYRGTLPLFETQHWGKFYRIFTINSLFCIKILMRLLHLSAFCKIHGVVFVYSVSRFAAKKYDFIIIVPVIAMAAHHCMHLVP
jgi:hypothetical protein